MHCIIKKLAFCFFLFFLLFSLPSKSETATILDITEDDFVIGNEDAPITIIEYASLSCSHCADFHINTLPKLISEFADTGKVRIVFRDFPFNYPALLGTMLLKCIPKDLRYEYTSALYKLQSSWVNRENAKTIQELYKIMQSGGMSKDNFDKCIFDVDLENQILQGVIAAQEGFNIKSTPSFIINGKLRIEGNKPLKDFRQIVDKILSE